MTTTYLGMTEPTVGADSDTWGDELNLCLNVIDIFAGNAGASILSGLTLSTAGGSATFSCAAGVAGSTTGRIIPVDVTSKTTSSWVVGSGNGALDTGAIANSTWYHVFVIMRLDTGVTDVLISTSPTSPTMPTGYTLKRRIGAMKTNGSAQWTAFSQVGDEFLWLVPVQDLSTSSLGAAENLSGMSVPTGIKPIALLRGDMSHASANTLVLVTSPDATNAAPSAGNYTSILQVGSQSIALGELRIRTNTLAQIRSRSSAASTTLELVTYGWIDPRGKF